MMTNQMRVTSFLAKAFKDTQINRPMLNLRCRACVAYARSAGQLRACWLM